MKDQKLKHQKGQAMVEYGIIVALIAIVGIAGMQMMGNSLVTVFENVVDVSVGASEFGGGEVGTDVPPLGDQGLPGPFGTD